MTMISGSMRFFIPRPGILSALKFFMIRITRGIPEGIIR